MITYDIMIMYSRGVRNKIKKGRYLIMKNVKLDRFEKAFLTTVDDFAIPQVAGSLLLTPQEQAKFEASFDFADVTDSYVIVYPFAVIKTSNNTFGVFVAPTGEIPCKFIHNIYFVTAGTVEFCCKWINDRLSNASVKIFEQKNIAEISLDCCESPVAVEYEETYSILSTIQNETYIYFINLLGYKVRFESPSSIKTYNLINTAISTFNSEDEQTRAKYLSDVLTNGFDNLKVKIETAHGYATYMVMVDRYNFKLGKPIVYKEYLDTYHFRLD